MGVGAGLYMYVVVVQKFTFAISSPDEFLVSWSIQPFGHNTQTLQTDRQTDRQNLQAGQTTVLQTVAQKIASRCA